jgi:hypothetical protein
VRDSLKGLALTSPEGATLHDALDFGGLAVLRDAWSRFGLQEFFAGLPQTSASRLQAIIFSRLLFPCAKLALAGQARGTLLAPASTARPSLRKSASPFTTSRAFISKVTAPVGLARYGHSRDHRPDRPQVNLAVVTDESGIPISQSVLRGNRADNKTLLGLLKLLKRRFGIAEATFVFDEGMSGEINLKAMSAAGLNYVTRLSNATLDSLIADNPQTAAEVAQMELGDAPRLIEI